MGDKEMDSQRHQQLLEKVETFTKRSDVGQRTEGAATASEYHLHHDAKVSVEGLLGGLKTVGKKSILLNLKNRLGGLEKKNQKLNPPLNKIKTDQVNRRAANQESCKEVGKWAPIVKRNREAEHLSFPIQQDSLPSQSLSTKLESFTPSTELELEVAAVLARSKNVESEDDHGLTKAEKKSFLQMTVEEAMERKKALQKHRALLSYYEQKCRRIGRIKSKKFHKVQRKRLEKLGNKPEVTEEELMKLRAKERMTLKHSNKAKWAKKQHTREHKDPATRQALSEHHNRKIQLKQKVSEREKADSESEEERENEEQGSQDSRIDSVDVQGNPWLSALDSKAFDTHDRPMAKSSISMTKSATLSDGHIDTSSFLVSNMANGKGQLGPASDQLLAVREAFSGDNVVEQFEREKAELEAQEMIEDSPTVLPGWGRWGGEGVKPPRKTRRRVKKPRPPRKPRKDAQMKHVIIAEEQRNKKIIQHLVQSVPWPYTSREQFDKTNSTPVGRHWNTEATFQQMIKPKVTTGTGELIEPLMLTEEVQDYIKRSEVKKKERRKRK